MTPIDRRTPLKSSASVADAAGDAAALPRPVRRATAKADAVPTQAPAPVQTYVTPYAVTTSSALSQDYFDTAAVLMDAAGDTVVPFLANGQVNALVLSGSSGALSLLQPDPSQPSGWSMSFVPDPSDDTGQTPLNDVQTVAAANYAGQVWMLVILSASYGGGALGAPAWSWLNWDPVEGWGYAPLPQDYALVDDIGDLATATDPNGNPYFYAFNDDNSFYLWSPPLGGDVRYIADLQGQVFSNQQLVWDPGFNPSDATNGGVLGTDSSGNNVYFEQTGQFSFDVTAASGQPEYILWSGWAMKGSKPTLAQIVQFVGSSGFRVRVLRSAVATGVGS